jgi:2-polyprenyl-6-methoxyphenol hydroxylase-like FAD-dependent oxidoreductase
MTPNLGQGACQAIEDALELAAALAKPNLSVEQALRTYESRRMNRTKSIVLTSRRIGNLGQLESTPLCFLRNLVMRLTPVSATLNNLAPIVGYEGHLADPAEESQG